MVPAPNCYSCFPYSGSSVRYWISTKFYLVISARFETYDQSWEVALKFVIELSCDSTLLLSGSVELNRFVRMKSFSVAALTFKERSIRYSISRTQHAKVFLVIGIMKCGIWLVQIEAFWSEQLNRYFIWSSKWKDEDTYYWLRPAENGKG